MDPFLLVLKKGQSNVEVRLLKCTNVYVYLYIINVYSVLYPIEHNRTA